MYHKFTNINVKSMVRISWMSTDFEGKCSENEGAGKFSHILSGRSKSVAI